MTDQPPNKPQAPHEPHPTSPRDDGRLKIDFDALEGGEIKTFDSLPALKMTVRYGVFLWWSDQIPHWVHPDDVEIAERLVPGFRIFRRESCQNDSDRKLGFARLVYGNESFRALPIVWLEIAFDGFEVGDRVEVNSEHGKRRPLVATIMEMNWNRDRQRIEYRLVGPGLRYRRPYEAEQLKPALRLGGFLSEREQRLFAAAATRP